MKQRNNSLAFRPGKISGLEIKNRLVRAATFEALADDKGNVTEPQLGLHRRLAKGGVGLIITGHAAIAAGGASHRMTRIDRDDHIVSVRKIARAVHDEGNQCKVLLQLNHLGRQVLPATGTEPVSPSAVPDGLFQRTPRELRVEEIEALIEAFAQGVRRAREAEFDGVEIHAAHGWLLSSFLSPHTNRRQDRYGGDTESRARVLREIHEAAVKMVGTGFPIVVKMNTTDFLPGGIDPLESARIAIELVKSGFDALEASGGCWECLTRSEQELGWKPVLLPEARTEISRPDQEAYFWKNAITLRMAVDVPIVLVGGIKSIDKIEEILQEGSVDFCAMSRPLIRQSDLPNRWLEGTAPETSTCKSCNACLPRGDLVSQCRRGDALKILIPEK